MHSLLQIYLIVPLYNGVERKSYSFAVNTVKNESQMDQNSASKITKS